MVIPRSLGLAIFMLVGAMITPAAAETPVFDKAKLDQIAAKMQDFVERKETAGVVACVFDRNQIIYIAPVGYADLGAKRPIEPDSIFWIASMTKPLTAVAVMMLEEEGKLSIDDPASKYLPELANMKMADGSPTKPILVRHLLCHMAGLPENTSEETNAASRLQDLVDAFSKKPMQFEPGSRWLYSQTAINSLARIVEVISGERFEDFLDERLLKPLGMKSTTFYPAEAQLDRIARSYAPVDGGLAPVRINYLGERPLSDRSRVPLANGGLFSTAPDYARFLQMFMNGGELDGRRYLKEETIDRMTQIQTGDKPLNNDGFGWGLGFIVIQDAAGLTESLPNGTFGHSGAFGTQGWIMPDRKMGVVFMTQITANKDSALQRAFFKAVLDARAN